MDQQISFSTFPVRDTRLTVAHTPTPYFPSARHNASISIALRFRLTQPSLRQPPPHANMAAVVKKPPATGRETPTGTPQRQSPRAATPSSASSPGGAGVARTRSVRTGTPVSARAAASQRRESLLGSGSTTAGGSKANGSAADVEREEALRAETVAIIDDLKERLSQAESASEAYKRQAEVLQSKLDDALKEQAKMEEKVHESEEQIESLINEKREAARQMREMENIYEAERSAMMREKEEMANREEEMQAVIQRLKDSLAQRNFDEDRPTRQCEFSLSFSLLPF